MDRIYRIKRSGDGNAFLGGGHPIDCNTLEDAIRIVWRRFQREINGPCAPLPPVQLKLRLYQQRDGKLSFFITGYPPYPGGEPHEDEELTEVYDYTDAHAKYGGKLYPSPWRARAGG